MQFVQILTTETLHYFNNFNSTNQQQFALGLLERVRHASFSLIRSYDLFETEPPLIFSVGLTLRAIILDYLIMLKIIQVSLEADSAGKSKEELLQITADKSGEFLADGLENTFTYFETLRANNIIDENRLTEVFNKMGQQYSLLLNPHSGDGSKPEVKFNKAPTGGKIFKQLLAHQQLKNISLIYDAYLFFSKFDHFGILYFDVINTPLNTVIKYFNAIIQEVIFHTGLIYSFLHDYTERDGVVKGHFDDMSNYLNEHYLIFQNKKDAK